MKSNLNHAINDALIAQACALTGTLSLAELTAWVARAAEAHREATRSMQRGEGPGSSERAVDLLNTIEALLAWDATIGNDDCLVESAHGIAREIARRA